MHRRTLMLAAGAALAAPAAVRAQSATTLRFTPQQDLVTLDPVTTTAYISRNHGYMVFDTLYGMDGAFRRRRRWSRAIVVEDDGKRWDLTLREGLLLARRRARAGARLRRQHPPLGRARPLRRRP